MKKFARESRGGSGMPRIVALYVIDGLGGAVDIG